MTEGDVAPRPLIMLQGVLTASRVSVPVTPMAERWFQPTRNTRVGAVILYDAATIANPIAVRQRWRVIANPHARRPIPPEFLQTLQQLHDPLA